MPTEIQILRWDPPTEIQILRWDPAVNASVEEAEKAFERLQKEGMEFFQVKVKTQEIPGKRIKKFKRDLGKIMYGPAAAKSGKHAMAGGPPSSTQSAHHVGGGHW